MAFGLLRALIFLVLGICVLTTKLGDNMPGTTKIGLAVILIVYGCFRAYTDYKKHR